MKFLPIVERELRTLSRQWPTYWFRTLVASVVGGIVAAIVMLNRHYPPQDTAVYVFHTIGGGALLYCLFAGARSTADCISEEKREGTLGLLFLTDLKGYDVVLGKLAAFSVNSLYCLMAIIPFMALPLLMGGTNGTQVVYVTLVLIATMFLSVAAGIFASACCRSARRSVTLTIGIISVLAFVLPGIGLAQAAKTRTPPDWNFFLTSPIFAYVTPHDVGGWRSNLDLFVQSLGVIFGISVTLIVLACLVVPRSWRDKPPGPARLHWRERWRQWGYGQEVVRRGFRTRLLNENAFFWLAARDRLKPMWVWGLLGLLTCVWAWGVGKYAEDWVSPPVMWLTAFLLNCVLKSWFAAEATRPICEERRAGSLELLLVTSLRVEDIIRGQALALQRQFLWPVLVVLVCEIAMMTAGARQIYDGTEGVMWVGVWIGMLIMLVVDLFTLFWVGLWMGLASRQPKRAYAETVGRILALPWVLFILFLMGMVVISINQPTNVTWDMLLAVWILIGVMVDVGFGVWARTNFYTRAREMATRRFHRGDSWWNWLFGPKYQWEAKGLAKPNDGGSGENSKPQTSNSK